MSPDWNYCNTAPHSVITKKLSFPYNTQNFSNQTNQLNKSAKYYDNKNNNLMLENFSQPNVQKLGQTVSCVPCSEVICNNNKKLQIRRPSAIAFEMRSKSEGSPYGMKNARKQVIRQETINILRQPETEVSRQCQKLWHECSRYTALTIDDSE